MGSQWLPAWHQDFLAFLHLVEVPLHSFFIHQKMHLLTGYAGQETARSATFAEADLFCIKLNRCWPHFTICTWNILGDGHQSIGRDLHSHDTGKDSQYGMDDQKPYSKLFAPFFDHGTYFPYANGVSSAQILQDLLANEGPRRPKPEPPEEARISHCYPDRKI